MIGTSEGPWLTPAEIATDLRVSKMTIYRLLSTGELPSVRIGRSFRVARSALDTYLASNHVTSDGAS